MFRRSCLRQPLHLQDMHDSLCKPRPANSKTRLSRLLVAGHIDSVPHRNKPVQSATWVALGRLSSSHCRIISLAKQSYCQLAPCYQIVAFLIVRDAPNTNQLTVQYDSVQYNVNRGGPWRNSLSCGGSKSWLYLLQAYHRA